MSNPFLRLGEFPDFPNLTPAAANEALPRLLADARTRVDALEKTATPDWEGFVRALDDAQRPLFEAWGIVSHMQSVCNSDAWRKVEEAHQGDIVAFSLRVGQSRRFYELAKALRAKLSDPTRLRILDKMIQGAELAGVALEGEKQARFNEIQAELAKLSTDFHNHVLDATKGFSLMLTTPVEVEGLPAQLKAMMAGENDPQKGPWKATIEDAVYVPFMKHSRNRPVREALFRARATRAAAGGLDNTPLITRILSLRRELATLLGFANYAALSLASKSAPSVAAVDAMIDALAAASRPVAEKEDAALAAFAAANGFTGRLEPWDKAFWSERQREALYSYSEEELSRYFDLPVVLRGLFDLASRLFGVSVEQVIDPVPVWHADVRLYRVRNAAGDAIAHFYFDPYSRPATKSGGAWMNEFRSRELRPDDTLRRPLAVVCCNQALPDANGRALMRFSEVETLFHEFGHALQQMLTTVDDVDAAGLNLIDWDAVEVASQFMENWCYDAATLRSFARHVETNEPIPAALLARLRAAKNYRAANASLRQLSFAKVDMALHVEPVADPNALKEQVFATYTPNASVPEDRFLNAFTHIFAGGYAAGYYGYKWSEVMSADVFGAFEEAGLENEAAVRRVGRRYRETFLALGGSVDPMEVFRRFRGRAPSIEALLRQTGLK
ncbi:MAG: M3 family metallopeptidase [Kiritimatiellia bacterium]